MKRFLSLLIMMLMMLSLTACQVETEVEEEVVEEFGIEDIDLEYYERFKGKNISINVYNWGEYVPDGSEDGVIDLNAELCK